MTALLDALALLIIGGTIYYYRNVDPDEVEYRPGQHRRQP